MAADITTLDAHEQPSEYMRGQWKAYAKADPREIEKSGDIDEVDVASPAPFLQSGSLDKEQVARVLREFLDDASDADSASVSPDDPIAPASDVPIFFHPLLPGLLLIPNLVPPPVQKRLLDRMIHRDLSCPRHQTNMHLHYDLPYPPNGASFFSYPADDILQSVTKTKGRANPKPSLDAPTTAPQTGPVLFTPKDPTIHKPLSVRQVLDRRLHWVTLGGQYDWTNRVYPEGEDGEDEANRIPPFPRDITNMLEGLFPETKAEAAIVNFYTPGDTMMMHRDVSEETDKGLISLSIGCDALFMAAPTGEFAEDQSAGEAAASKKTMGPRAVNGGETPQKTEAKPYVLLRLRSGDAMYMSGHSRFAWHGVPKVIKGTCPEYIAEWPAGEHEDGRYEAWRDWMRNKRINLNVRQMRD